MKIHHWFIPTKKNRFHPIALRSTGLIVFLTLFIAIPFIYNITSTKQLKVLGYATNVNVNDLYNFSNQERIKAGLQPLNLNSHLNSAALAKAKDMMAKNYWAHIAPNGATPWSFILANGYQYTAAGENLAKDFNMSSGVVAGWMASPLHKANAMNTIYDDVGYAVVNGVLQGSETTLVVAMYGAQSDIVASTSTAPASTTKTTSITNQVSTIATNNSLGSVEGLSIYAPIKAYSSLNWGQKVSILLLCTLILLFIMKHTLIWREQKRGVRYVWLRAHPLGQMAILSTVLVITLFSGIGVVL
jgi:hypothetical protein